ncbi:MAG: adenine phosphoribosyltransferase [Ardenticatenia bacterium]|nr:adenine phosphoribosyltransferase [Ardenticatenia bacterium]
MEHLKQLIRDIPDFPIPGIIFKDITTLLKDAHAFGHVVDRLVDEYRDHQVDVVVAIESRGFIFGAPLAYKLNACFVPVRKFGKLPAQTVTKEYALEYGTSTLEMHVDAIQEGQRVLIVDDLLATGGTARATAELVETLGGHVVGFAFVVELCFLSGREKLAGYSIFSLIQYE